MTLVGFKAQYPNPSNNSMALHLSKHTSLGLTHIIACASQMGELCVRTLPLSLAVTFTSNCNERLMTLRAELALTSPLKHQFNTTPSWDMGRVISPIMKNSTLENERTQASMQINWHNTDRNMSSAIIKTKHTLTWGNVVFHVCFM